MSPVSADPRIGVQGQPSVLYLSISTRKKLLSGLKLSRNRIIAQVSISHDPIDVVWTGSTVGPVIHSGVSGDAIYS